MSTLSKSNAIGSSQIMTFSEMAMLPGAPYPSTRVEVWAECPRCGTTHTHVEEVRECLFCSYSASLEERMRKYTTTTTKGA